MTNLNVNNFKFTERDLKGYEKVAKAIAAAKELGETMEEGKTRVVGNLSIAVGKSTTVTTLDVEAVQKDFPTVTKGNYPKVTTRKASIKVNIISK